MSAPAADFLQLLGVLCEHEVRFVVVGGACAVLHGAPLQTLDLDIVHERSAENVQRLVRALESLQACYREHLPGKVLRPLAKDLAGRGHHLLMTRAGPLDVLGAIGHDRGHEELAPHSELVRLGDALEIRILDLSTLIRVKEESPRAKDALGLALLRETLRERDARPD